MCRCGMMIHTCGAYHSMHSLSYTSRWASPLKLIKVGPVGDSDVVVEKRACHAHGSSDGSPLCHYADVDANAVVVVVVSAGTPTSKVHISASG